MKQILIIIALFFMSLPAYAQEMDLHHFKSLPILHDGRVKPLDSFARHYLLTFSGTERFDGQPAINWLARTLFDPGHAAEDEIFVIRNPQALGLDSRSDKISYIALSAALSHKKNTITTLLKSDPAQWNADQQALIQYQESALIYGDLLRSLTMMLPLNITPPKALGMQGSDLTYSDISNASHRIDQRVKDIIRRKGDNPEAYSRDEKEIVEFAYQMSLLSDATAQNALFNVLPAGGAFVSPWMAAQDNEALGAWKTLARAWHQEDAVSWQQTVDALAAAQTNNRLTAEVLYNQAHPLGLAMVLYLAAFLSASLFAIFNKPFMRHAAQNLLLGAIAANSIAIGLRVFILARPPVGTLYESIIFVAVIAAIGGAMFARKNRAAQGLMAASLAGGLLLFIAEAFATDDTMKMLVAVLNTNFWLATHVLCITIGYGWCILTGLFAHFYLTGRASGRLDTAHHAGLIQSTKSLALIALLFTTIGTILGGIWADQSWGRFWGWDPKENGALLIVLWLAWCLHGSIAGQLKSLPFMASLAALNIIVALAWFGVNLLNTGLHSYGFIEGVAAALFGFITLDILLIGGLWYAAITREKKTHE